MVSLEDAVTARLESHGTRFEVLVDPDMALELRQDGDVDIEEMLAVDKIFKDASRGDEASEDMLEEVFDTLDVLHVAERIVEDGDVQLTSEQRNRIREEKHKQLVNEIARNAINPQRGDAPHPPERIERALEEGSFRVDPMKSVDEQVDEALDILRPLIPIRFERTRTAVKVPAEYTGQAYGQIREFGNLVKEEWQDDGSWVGVVETPGGLQDELEGLVNKLTEGKGSVKKV